jgi:quercetin dioxygenase-like cupin family protein
VSFRLGATVWNIRSIPLPADSNDDADGVKRVTDTAMKNTAVSRAIEYAPGVTPRNHRIDSIYFAVILSGEIDMELDDEEVNLKAGDVLVQRGTIHNWVNRGDKPCVIVLVLIDAAPVSEPGKKLEATG